MEYSSIFLAKTLILASGIIVLGIGTHSYLQSESPNHSDLLDMCAKYAEDGQNCPNIAVLHFFVGMVIGCFIMSFVNIVSECNLDLKSGFRRIFDIWYHVLCTILLFAAAVLYIISAVKFTNILESKSEQVKDTCTEMIVAGTFAIIQAIMYTMVTIAVIYRQPEYSRF